MEFEYLEDIRRVPVWYSFGEGSAYINGYNKAMDEVNAKLEGFRVVKLDRKNFTDTEWSIAEELT